jgi:diguanylate cyclase (GGDEF)-like protein
LKGRGQAMKNLWEFYENLNEIVYVSDIETYELIYMNRKAREIHGLSDNDEYKGLKCYEILQMNDKPCSICNNQSLKPNVFQEWKRFNPNIQRTYILKDTLIEYEGRKCRLELAIDITVQEEQQKTIENYMNNEAIINEGLNLAMAESHPIDSLTALIKYFGKALESDRFFIFEKDADENYNNTYEWCKDGIKSKKDSFQNIPSDDIKGWLDKFYQVENVVIDTNESNEEYSHIVIKYLIPNGISSIVITPLIYKGELIGFCGADNPPKELMDNISTLFKIMGKFVVSLIRKRNYYSSLTKMSYLDQLTGLGNRYSLTNCVTSIHKSHSIGIVYCDITGLKLVNDTDGHEAGDKLIIRNVICLQNVFNGYNIFRIGGDEFLVLCDNISEDELKTKIELLKIEINTHSIALAIGYAWEKEYNEDINRLISEAEALMYDDKRRYYAIHDTEQRKN